MKGADVKTGAECRLALQLWERCPTAEMSQPLGQQQSLEKSSLTPAALLSSLPQKGKEGQIERKSESWGPGS